MKLRRGITLLVRGLLGLTVAITLAIALLWWLSVRQIVAESEVVETAAGPVEVSRLGEAAGQSILLVHGSPGGYDQLLPLARALSAHGHHSVAMSRPGYLRTPLSVGRTPEEQADAMAALVRELDLAPVVVVAVSGGGPSTLQLALRHPELVRGVVLICAVTSRFREGEPDPDQVRAFDLAWDLGALAGRWSPGTGLQFLGVSDSERRSTLLANEETAAAVRYLFQSMGFNSRRHGGYRNDVLTMDWNDLDYPLESLRAPVLLLHGADDVNVPLAHSRKVADRAPDAALRVLEGAGHAFFVVEREWLEAQIADFLQKL
ncbi:MAG: alpha/beta hydrolase [Thermoanaerobaculia bacterium]|nr:alpha/beta hydrolase [Thermoanaerobaculia bacterium]